MDKTSRNWNFWISAPAPRECAGDSGEMTHPDRGAYVLFDTCENHRNWTPHKQNRSASKDCAPEPRGLCPLTTIKGSADPLHVGQNFNSWRQHWWGRRSGHSFHVLFVIGIATCVTLFQIFTHRCLLLTVPFCTLPSFVYSVPSELVEMYDVVSVSLILLNAFIVIDIIHSDSRPLPYVPRKNDRIKATFRSLSQWSRWTCNGDFGNLTLVISALSVRVIHVQSEHSSDQRPGSVFSLLTTSYISTSSLGTL